MKMTEIKSGSITITLDPTDAFILACACSAAGYLNESSVPVGGHFAGLGIAEEALAVLYSTMGTMFDAAGTAGVNQFSTPMGEQEALSLTAIRKDVYRAEHPGEGNAPKAAPKAGGA